MASIRKEIRINVKPEDVWTALTQIGSVHKLFPGVLLDSHLDGASRLVTFANGAVVRELIIDVDATSRRFVYAAVEGGVTTHHNSSWQLFDDGDGGTRFVWISDFVPNEATGVVQQLVDSGSMALKQTLEAAP